MLFLMDVISNKGRAKEHLLVENKSLVYEKDFFTKSHQIC